MTIDAGIWLGALVLLPAAVALASYTRLHVERLRRLAVVTAVTLLGISSLALFVEQLRAVRVSRPVAWAGAFGEQLLVVDEFSSALLPLAAGLWLLAVATTPRARLDRQGLARTAWSTLVTMACFTTRNPALLALLWAFSVGLYRAALVGEEFRHARRVAGVYLGAATVILAAGVALLFASDTRGTWWETAGLWLVIVAAMIRKGIFPFHAWLPEAFEHGRLGPVVLFSAPQVGAYVMAVLVVPRADPDALHVVAVLALFTAVYGAVLALDRVDARRACGYLFVSQSALVMAGLDCSSHEALTGSLVLWISSGIGFAGLARCVLVLEARRGRLALSRHHGGYEQMPLLAVSFLLLGLACTGFPGTLGFVGEELLLDGAVEAFPVLGFSVVAVGALTGLAVLRMYGSLFCGHRGDNVHLGLVRREVWVFAVAAGFLLASGIAPDLIIRARARASDVILQARQSEVRERTTNPEGHDARMLRYESDGRARPDR